MADFNKVIMTGAIVSTPEIKETSNGKPYIRFRLASTTGWGKFEQKSFLTCQAYGNTVDYVHKYGEKGRKVLIDGEIAVLDRKNEGGYSTSVFLTVRDIKFIDTNGNGNGNGGSKETSTSFPTEQYTPSSAVSDDDEEDLPF